MKIMDKFLSLPKEKQTTIRNAALQCFGKYGYEKASVNDIATAAHISKASVFQYFGSKKQLYTYLLQYCGDIAVHAFNQEVLDEQADLFERIWVASKMKTAAFSQQPYVSQFIATAWAETAPEVHDLLESLKEYANNFRNDLVLREDDKTKFKNSADAPLVFQMLLLMAEGYAARYRGAESFDFDTVMQEFEQIITMLRNNFYKEEFQ